MTRTISSGSVDRSPIVEARSGLPEDEIRVQLERILGHREFEATERLRSFLRFVIEETLAGRASRINGRRIATQVFGRGEDFDAARDPIVRTEAGRLRRALERYSLLAGVRDPIRIDIPKGRYVPRFTGQPASRTRASDEPMPAGQRALPPEGPTVAVLPFQNLTDESEKLYFVNGLVEELVAEVNRYQDVVAVPCQRVVSGGSGDVRLLDLSGEVGARFLLGGSVRRDESAVKVTAQLNDSTMDRQIWGRSYTVDLEAAGLIATQEGIARDVIAAIAGEYGIIANRLSGESRGRPPAELGTYDAMLRYHHYMLVMTPSACEEAFVALHRAIDEEPAHGPAWSALAHLYAVAYEFDDPDIESPLLMAKEYAHRGAALAPESQLARTILAYIHLLSDKIDLCLGEADVALALNPNSPNFLGAIGYLLICCGEYERGSSLLRDAIALNHCHPHWFHHGLFIDHFQRGDYENAYREAEMVGYQLGFWDPAIRVAVLGKLGRLSEARAAVPELLSLKPDFERRIRDILPRALKPLVVREEILDGLRKAGLRIDE